MRRAEKILLFFSFLVGFDCSKESLIDLVAFGALVKMMAHLRKQHVDVFSRKLKIHEPRKDVEELRAKDLLILNGKNTSH
jgi:hypothetical protein